MGFTPEQRIKGGKNSKRGVGKETKKVRAYISKILSDEVRAERELKALSGMDYWIVVLSLMHYTSPNLRFIETMTQNQLAARQNLTPKTMPSD